MAAAEARWRREVAPTRNKARWPPEGCRYETEETDKSPRQGAQPGIGVSQGATLSSNCATR